VLCKTNNLFMAPRGWLQAVGGSPLRSAVLMPAAERESEVLSQ
jgi:hypothetical protein